MNIEKKDLIKPKIPQALIANFKKAKQKRISVKQQFLIWLVMKN